MPKNIIPDSSCLILLEKISHLEILNNLYNRIVITPTVSDEYGLPVPEWIHIQPIKNRQYQTLIQASVDPGEASVIALAIEIGGLLVLDDLKARKLAANYHLDYTGTLGILIEAKRSGHIQSFKAILNRIRQTNFHMTEALERKLLDLSEE